MHQKLMLANGMGFEQPAQCPLWSSSASNQECFPSKTSLYLFWRETHASMHFMQRPIIVPSTLECAQQSDSVSAFVLRGVFILISDQDLNLLRKQKQRRDYLSWHLKNKYVTE